MSGRPAETIAPLRDLFLVVVPVPCRRPRPELSVAAGQLGGAVLTTVACTCFQGLGLIEISN
jgi:hypothetical protein